MSTLPRVGLVFAFVLFGASLALAQTLEVNGTAAPTSVSIAAGTVGSVSVGGGPGNTGDWVGLFPAGAQYDWQYVDRKFLNGLSSPPAVG
jgi:hypothetical protein